MTYDVQSPDVARLWPYLPDWAGGFDVRRGFKTDIVTSRNNTEQRRATRTDPRISVEYRTVVSDGDFRDAKHFLRAWQNKPAIIPDFARWARTTAQSNSGTSALTVDPMPVWAVAGQNLILCGAGNVMERVLVASIAGTTINLEDTLDSTWASNSVLRPTFFGLLDGKIGARRPNRGAAEIEVSLDCYPGGEPARDEGSAWATYNSREIFTLVPDYSGPPSVQSLWPVERVDFGVGRTAEFRPIDRAETLVELDFKGLSPTEVAEVEQFFDRMKGRRTAFYMPTFEKDFELVGSAGSGTAIITVEGNDLFADFGSVDYSDEDMGLAICLTTGTNIYRKITDIGSSGGNSTITVDANWGTGLNTSNVARISWMPVRRFAADEMTTGWKTTLSADVRLPFQSVKV